MISVSKGSTFPSIGESLNIPSLLSIVSPCKAKNQNQDRENEEKIAKRQIYLRRMRRVPRIQWFKKENLLSENVAGTLGKFSDSAKDSTHTMDDLTRSASDAVATAGVNRVKEMFTKWKEETFTMKASKSWGLFCDRSKFSFPSVTEAWSRFRSNLSSFQGNYVMVFFVIVLYSM